jgi:hypothetical protein
MNVAARISLWSRAFSLSLGSWKSYHMQPCRMAICPSLYLSLEHIHALLHILIRVRVCVDKSNTSAFGALGIQIQDIAQPHGIRHFLMLLLNLSIRKLGQRKSF